MKKDALIWILIILFWIVLLYDGYRQVTTIKIHHSPTGYAGEIFPDIPGELPAGEHFSTQGRGGHKY